MSILRTENLNKVYDQGEVSVRALTECNIKVEKGEFITIIGSSGSGKSTLLNLCGGLTDPTSGKVYIDDLDIYSLSSEALAKIRRQKIGFVFQSYHLMPILTAYENIILPALLDNRKVDKDYVKEIATSLKVNDRLHHFPGQLSGGQQQRMAIARALINQPSIILADEPTGNLDKKSAAEVLELLVTSVKKYGQTLLMITHEPSIADMADRVLHIDNGIVDEVVK